MRDFINNYWENSGFTLNLKPWCDNHLVRQPLIKLYIKLHYR